VFLYGGSRIPDGTEEKFFRRNGLESGNAFNEEERKYPQEDKNSEEPVQKEEGDKDFLPYLLKPVASEKGLPAGQMVRGLFCCMSASRIHVFS